MSISKDQIYFLLVRTEFASNLGSAVRAMKNMGFHKLALVEPHCEVGMEARALAMKGASVLDQAAYFPSLEAAAEEINLLVGTTGRFQRARRNLTTARVFAEEIIPRFSGSTVGVVFGSEDNGLRREELRVCQWLVEIPTDSDYASMNLAQAVAVVAYELNMASRQVVRQDYLHEASREEVQALLHHIRELLQVAGFPKRISIPRVMKRLRKIAGRAQLEREDVNLLHGLLSQIDKRIGKNS